MTVSKLIRFKDTTPLKKQCGNYVIVANNNRFYGYEILTYDKYVPDTLRLVSEIENPVYEVISWDTAFDRLFGNPIMPDFSKVLN